MKADHKISLLKTYLQEIVYGGNDGIISTFVVVSGFSGAAGSDLLETSLSLTTLLLFGFTNLFADAVSMGLGNFLSVRADKDVYNNLASEELNRLHLEKDKERAETEYILREKGFTISQARDMTDMISQNKPFWLNFMMDAELGIDNVLDENPFLTSLITFVSFIVFGFIPLIPYVFWGDFSNKFLVSTLSTGFALVILGILRSYLTNKNTFKTIFEMLSIGTAASGVAYLVGTLF